MPKVVVVLPSTTYRAGDFVSAAESLGIDLVVASENPAPLEMGEGYVRIDCSEPEKAAGVVTALGDEVPVDGVVAADDEGVIVAALAGTALGLRANSRDAAASTRDKLAMRRRLQAAEVPQPRFGVLEPGDSPEHLGTEVGLPLVIKPRARSASQGVIRVDDVEDLQPTVDRIRRIIGDTGRQESLLFESFMPGAEVAVEGLITDEELTVLALFDKPDTGAGPFFGETIFITPSRLPAPTQSECVRVAQLAVRGLGLSHGPVHIELKADGNQVRVIEVAARSIGGLCSRSLSFGLMGTTLESLILRNALGMDKPELRRESHASGVLMIPIPASGMLKSIDGIDTLRSIDGITGVDITISPGSEVLAPPVGDRYLGFVFARAGGPDQVDAALRKAMASITVEVE